MSSIQINEETCNKCGICAAVCVAGLIETQEDGYPAMSRRAGIMCNRCGACLIGCPTGSLDISGLAQDQFRDIDRSLGVNFEQFSHMVMTRRSVRVYKDEPVPREDITRILDSVRYSPTGGNSQNVKWLIIDDKEKLDYIREIGTEFMLNTMRENPGYARVVDFFIDRKDKGIDIFTLGAPAIISTYADATAAMSPINCAIALSYFDLAANSAGLGCCWLGFFISAANNFAPIRDMLSLPEGTQVNASMAVGYPKYRYHKIPVRNPADITWL